MCYKEIAKAAESNSELLKKIYDNLASPGVSQVGKAFGSILGLVNTALFPINFLNGKAGIYLEHSLDKYRSSLQNIPLEQIIDVLPEIGVPILEKLSYISADELSDMYINLLSKASSKESVDQAHPSFVLALSSLSSDEAIFLNTIREMAQIPFITMSQMTGRSATKKDHILLDYVVHSSVIKDLMFKKNIGLYMSNLVSLGIFELNRDQYTQQNSNSCLDIWEEQKQWRIKTEDQMPSNARLNYKEGSADITPFGKMFISACLTSI